MRLQLILLAASALAQDHARARVDVYDDGALTVIAPAAGVSVTRKGTRYEADWTIDALSAATPVLTVDGLSSATRFQEARGQLGVSVTRAPSTAWSVTAGVMASVQPDHLFQALTFGGALDLLERMATVRASATTEWISTGTSTHEIARETSVGQALDLSWSHILGRSTVLVALVSAGSRWCGPVLGCDANPYRYAPVRHDGVAIALRERHPDRRARLAGGLRLSQALGADTAVHASYRGYTDSWGIDAHTAGLAVARTLADERLLLRLEARGTLQSAADFAGGAPGWRTADPELGGVTDGGLTGRASWTFYDVGQLESLAVGARVSRLLYVYPDLDDRRAWIAGGGVDVAF